MGKKSRETITLRSKEISQKEDMRRSQSSVIHKNKAKIESQLQGKEF